MPPTSPPEDNPASPAAGPPPPPGRGGRWARRAVRPLAILAVAALPAVLAVALVHGMFHRDVTAFMPYQPDEFNYWRQIATFAERGWSGGYYTVEEHPAPAGFTHFGAHGPVFVALYGTLAKAAGWHLGSPPLFNMALVAAAILLLAWIGRPDLRQLGLVALVLSVFWPVQTFLVSHMQEPVHDAVAIVLAALFARLIAAGDAAPAGLKAATAALVVLAALMRPTWGVLLLPLSLLVTGARHGRAAALSLAGGTLLAAGLFALYGWLAAPYPAYVVSRAVHATDPGRAWAALTAFVGSNVAGFFHPRFTTNAEVLDAFQRLVVGALIGVSGVRLARAAWARRKGRAPAGETAFDLFHLLNLAGVVALCLLLLPVRELKDYRPIAPHLLLSLLVYVLAARRRIPLLAAAAYAALVVVFLNAYHAYNFAHFNYAGKGSYLRARAIFQRDVADRVAPDPAGGPWENTLLVEWPTYNMHLLAIDRKIGVSRVFDWDRVRYPIRSKYVFITRATYDRVGSRMRLRPLSEGPFGGLYLNLDNTSVTGRAGG